MDAAAASLGVSQLKPWQRQVIAAWSSGRDVFVLSGTGTGKSLCFQLPALLIPPPSVVIVISPLISLMRDQCAHMQRSGVASCYLGSGQDDPLVASAAMKGEYRLVYACPETLVTMQRQLQVLHEV